MKDDTASQTNESYRLINAGGNHYDIGRKMTDAITPRLLERLGGAFDAKLLKSRIISAEYTFSVHPVLRDEIQGICEGISIETDGMIFEITGCAQPTHSVTVLLRKNGGITLGRNFSSSPSNFVLNLLRLDPNDSYASLGRMCGYFAGTWESTGVYGIHVSADVLDGRCMEGGVSAYMVPRILTESSKDIGTALEKLKTMKIVQPSSFIVADRNSAYSALFEGGDMKLEKIETFPALFINGRRGESIDAEDAWEILMDHGRGFCLHENERATLYSLCVDFTEELIQYTDGSPCLAERKNVDWPGGYG